MGLIWAKDLEPECPSPKIYMPEEWPKAASAIGSASHGCIVYDLVATWSNYTTCSLSLINHCF